MEDRKMQDSMKDVFEILKIKITFICDIWNTENVYNKVECIQLTNVQFNLKIVLIYRSKERPFCFHKMFEQ